MSAELKSHLQEDGLGVLLKATTFDTRTNRGNNALQLTLAGYS